jgi:outer membrane protein assembly factor BamB
MKKILFFLLLTFMACKKEVQVETLKNTSLEEAWCVDLPKDILQYQQYHFVYEDDIYFVTNFIGHITLYQVNKNSKLVSKIPLNWESVGEQSSTSIRYFDVKQQGKNLYLLREKSLFSFDLINKKLSKKGENISFFEASENENKVYTLHQTDASAGYDFKILNTQTLDYEAIATLKTAGYIEHIKVFKTEQGDELAFINTYDKHFLCDIKKKIIIREKATNIEIEGSDRELLFMPPYAINQIDKFYKFDMRTGKKEWSLEKTPLRVGYHKLTYDEKNSKIFVLEQFDKVRCIDTKSGKIVWETSFEVEPNDSYHLSFQLEIFLLNDVLYVSNGERLVLSDSKSGKEIQRQTENYMLGSPSIIDEKNNLIYTFKDAQLCALKGLK